MALISSSAKTQLSLTATPGMRYSFLPKSAIGYWNFNANNRSFNYNARIKAFNFNANSKAFNFNARATPGV